MDQEKDPEEFYESLKTKLEEGFNWPETYLYKFIIPADDKKIAEIENIFDFEDAVITIKESSKGKYVSVTIKAIMESPQHVIDKYIEVGERVTGIISL